MIRLLLILGVGLLVIIANIRIESFAINFRSYDFWGFVAQASADSPVAPSNNKVNKTDIEQPPGLNEVLPAVELITNQEIYMLGEPAIITLQILNQKTSPIDIHKPRDMGAGLISLEIAYEGGEFKRYIGPGFGVKSVFLPISQLMPNEIFSISFRVLYHNVSKLSEDLPSFYAFEKPGNYLLRAELINIIPGRRFFTQPIKISFVAPNGIDARVWRFLQTKAAAYFLHTGRPLKDISIVNKFEQIIAQYPDSNYIPNMRAAVEKFRTLEKYITKSTPTRTVESFTFGDRTLFVRALPTASYTEKEVNALEILNLIDSWSQAYNANDVSKMYQYFMSRNVKLKKKWDQGPGDKDHERVISRYNKEFASTGPLTIVPVSIDLNRDKATVDVLVHFDHDPEREPHYQMKFVREDDGDWKILETGF